ncbi:MAG: hypothetical protein R3E48_16705 [Burkholderiaceae bacterium]
MSALPTITDQVSIDATTDDSFPANSNRPAIIIDGNDLTGDGLVFSGTADGSSVRGLVIRDFTGNGITLQIGADNITIAGNYIGQLTTSGTSSVASDANTGVGVWVNGANNLIGGSTSADRNLISGNYIGVFIDSGSATGNRVMGNYIGTDITGAIDIGNNDNGVQVNGGASGNMIGTDLNSVNDASEGNLISGNVNNGVQIWASNGNFVRGNVIGLNAAGTSVLANDSQGIQVAGGSSSNTVGGTTAAAANIVAGNAFAGIELNSGSGNVVQGNYVGTNPAGAAALGNGNAGIFLINGTSSNTIGGSVAGARNYVSGNQNGILVQGTGTTNNVIQANYVGTTPDGLSALANTFDGIRIDSGATSNTIGGSVAGMGNVVSGNGQEGIEIGGEASDNNVIRGNRIGVSAGGTALGNVGDGIFVTGGADGTIIGGTGAAEGNWIADAGIVGIEVDGASTGTVIRGNRIGTDLAGTANWGSQESSVLIEGGATGTVVGGINAGEANVIAFGGQGGIWTANISLAGASTTGNVISGNSIYGAVGLGIDINNDGVTANDASDPDTGPNNQQNFPVITGALLGSTGTSMTVLFTLNSTPSTTFTFEFYATNTNDRGEAEAEIYLGTTTVATDAGGNLGANYTRFRGCDRTNPVMITATARNTATGDTSELFAATTAVSAHVAIVDTTSDVVDGNTTNLAALAQSRGADGRISLREAIIAANNTANIDGSTPDQILQYQRCAGRRRAHDRGRIGAADDHGFIDHRRHVRARLWLDAGNRDQRVSRPAPLTAWCCRGRGATAVDHRPSDQSLRAQWHRADRL